jgi:hypothetical protein
MTRKRPQRVPSTRIPRESPTKPGRRKPAANAASERETLPPPADGQSLPPAQTTNSGVRPRPRRSIPAATVDEVTADLTKDPRRED